MQRFCLKITYQSNMPIIPIVPMVKFVYSIIETNGMKIEQISKIFYRNLLFDSVILRVKTGLMMNFP